LWEKRESIEVEGAIKSYLLRSTHNACLNHIKHEKIKQAHVDHDMHVLSEGEERDLLEEEEFRQKVMSSVQQLPGQCRKIFLMSRVQGKKYQQIADELNLSIKTIENQMGKALRTLRAGLNEERKSVMNVVKTIFWFVIGVNVFSIVMR
jgi:RNA polymerase sigma-70 factor, ECF subfamily